MYAVIRIRGTVNMTPRIGSALETMNLRRVSNLSLWSETPQSFEMIKKVKDYVTYGKIDDATLKELIEKRAKPVKAGEKVDAKKVFAALKEGKYPRAAGIKNLFKMSPPKGGYERKGIKVVFRIGGALGDRKEKINELIQRMM
jgi:large subunit ribosomal protein L30